MIRKVIIATVVALGLIFSLVGSGLAQQPAYGSGITVDGDPSEWNLTNDFFADMHEAGRPTKTLLSKSYLRYNCTSNTLYVLVLTENGVTADISATDAWIKIYDISNSPQADGNSASFAWLPNNAGYEASFSLAEDSYSELEIHLNVTWDGESGRTSSTGKRSQGNAIPLEIVCEAPPTNTFTPIPPTNTFTPILPTNTFTPTSTFTPILPTNTFTPTSTFTPIIPPTPTSTFTPLIPPTPTSTFTPLIPPTPTSTFTPLIPPTPTSTFTPLP